jgi:ribosomal protein S12 methylthiotransferase accessory factor
VEAVATVEATAEPIRVRREKLRSPKHFQGTTQRVCAPEETLERIRPLARLAGVTRTADITGLDRIGIPCTLAIRPNARSLVGSSGKGTTTIAATVSGLMEAIEIHHAEETQLVPFVATHAELVDGGIALSPFESLPVAKHGCLRPDLPVEWVWGWDIARQVEAAVPFASVHLRGRGMSGAAMRGQWFQTSSNGLASGNSLLEAIMAGMNEVIERDAVTLHRLRLRLAPGSACLVDLGGFGQPAVGALVERCRAADVYVLVHDITSDIGLPTYRATLVDARAPHAGAFGGYGSHLDPEIAMIRAITEAVQSRAVIIAGSRDDLFTIEHLRNRLLDNVSVREQRLGQPVAYGPPRVSEATATFEEDIAIVIRKLARVGLDRVIVVDLSVPEFGIDVVRVSVPGLEGHSKFPFYAPGERARHLAAAA